MLKWEDKTDFFSEERRHWCGRYLLQCEVALDEIEVDVYSSSDLWEVFVQFGIITGVSYEKEENIYELRDSYTDNYIGTAELHESCVESYEEVSDCVCI